MASQSINTTILIDPEDWENWYRDLRSGVLQDIWPLVDPDGPDIPLRVRPEEPEFTEYHPGAIRFSALTQTEQKAFMSAQHIYDSRLKDYNHQSQRILDIRNKIHLSISDAKKALLPIESSTKEWLQILMKSTKPSGKETRRLAGLRYQKAIRPLRDSSAKTVIPWIQEWETAMAEGTRAQLTQALNTEVWLGDFCAGIRGIAESFATAYELSASKGEEDVTSRGWKCIQVVV